MPRNYVAAAADLTAVADAIRAKASTANGLTFPAGFISAVEGISATGNTPAESGLNIVWGDTAPESAEGLWVKSAEPKTLIMTPDALPAAQTMSTVPEVLAVARYDIAAAAVEKKIYLFGGETANGSTHVNTIQRFDTETATLTTLSTTLPAALQAAAAVAMGTKIYLFGGYESAAVEKIQMFDTETETLTTLSVTLPTAVFHVAAAAVGKKIYLFGGGQSTAPLNTINVFDTEAETVTTLSTTLPTAVHSAAAVAVGTKIYLFGGFPTNSSVTDAIRMFDTEDHTVTTLSAVLPDAAGGIGAAAVGSTVYLFGGDCRSSVLQTVNAFNVEDGTITTLSAILPVSVRRAATAAVGTKVYLFGGRTLSNPKDSICEFAAQSELEEGLMYLQTGLSGTLFNLVSSDAVTVKMGVTAAWLGDENNAAQPVEIAMGVDGEWISL